MIGYARVAETPWGDCTADAARLLVVARCDGVAEST